MLLSIIIIITASVLCLIGLLHIYWVLGGTWGLQAAMPESYKADFFNESNKVIMNIATLTIAIGLLCFAYIILSNLNLLYNILPSNWTHKLTGIIGLIFFIRTIGDFKMFGLFKKKSDSLFAKKDSQIFIPICLFLAASCFYIYFVV